MKMRCAPPGEHCQPEEEENAEITGKGRMLYYLRKNLSIMVALFVIFVRLALIATSVVLSGGGEKSASLAMSLSPTMVKPSTTSRHVYMHKRIWRRDKSSGSVRNLFPRQRWSSMTPTSLSKCSPTTLTRTMNAQHSFETRVSGADQVVARRVQ